MEDGIVVVLVEVLLVTGTVSGVEITFTVGQVNISDYF